MNTNRRTFLSLVGAAGVAAAAGKPVRAAVYGVGHAHARSKIRVLGRLPQFELAGVCPRDVPQRFDAVTAPGVRRLERDEVLEDPSIELVAVEAHVAENLQFAHEAVDAGKFVHLDKSPGADFNSFRNLLDKASAKGRVVQMGYMWRYHTAMSRAIETARAGDLGEIYMVRATINKPMSEEDRRPLAAFKGGMMFEMGGHMIDRIVDLLGAPKRVDGQLRHDGPFDDGLADNNLALLEFDRAMAEVYVAAMQPNGNSYRRLEILGTKGTATVQPFSPDGRIALDFGAGREEMELAVAAQPYETDFVEMAAVIREGRKPQYSVDHDLAVQKALLDACEML